MFNYGISALGNEMFGIDAYGGMYDTYEFGG